MLAETLPLWVYLTWLLIIVVIVVCCSLLFIAGLSAIANKKGFEFDEMMKSIDMQKRGNNG